MSQDEVNKAAERLLHVYHEDEPSPLLQNGETEEEDQIRNDTLDVARAYLAERDPKPVDESWLRSIGATCIDPEVPEYEITVGRFAVIFNGSIFDVFLSDGRDELHLRDLATRGQVLQLLRCLGVETKEADNATK